MRLRHRLLAPFGLFAVTRLLGIAAFGYARSLRSFEALVDNEASEQAERIARASHFPASGEFSRSPIQTSAQ